jgi:ribonuclease HI
MVFGLRDAKDMDIDSLIVFGDSKLIINQVKKIYQSNQ